jgi:peptidoglycan/xylan/chitin deacetylase (PgdA/CDA1 family)
MLADNHEIGVHVHPKEFGYEHDRLARLNPVQQQNLIRETRTSVANAADLPEDEIISFRAGRHSIGQTTWRILAEEGFETDASVNVQYEEKVPKRARKKCGVFKLPNDLVEIPISWYKPPLFSLPGLWSFPQRTVTATSSTIRIDRRGCTGYDAFQWLVTNLNTNLSTYLHPHDATDYHKNLDNNGKVFRKRFEKLVHNLDCEQVTASQIAELCDGSKEIDI